MEGGGEHRILITGATGFVGTALCRLLAEKAPEAEIVPVGHGADRGRTVELRDAEAVARMMESVRPTAVIHLAAVAAPLEARRSPRVAWEINVTGTMNLARAVLECAPKARFVHVGSSEAYGASFLSISGPIDENAPLRPMTPYAASKAAADLLVGQMSYDGLNAIRFRPFNHTGPGQSPDYVISAFARQIAEIMKDRRAPVIDVGNLDAKRDFLDVRDVVRAYADTALDGVRLEGPGLVFNLASGRTVRIGAILERLIALSGREIEIRVDPEKLRPVDVPTTKATATAAREKLGWTPVIPLETTLSDILSYWHDAI